MSQIGLCLQWKCDNKSKLTGAHANERSIPRKAWSEGHFKSPVIHNVSQASFSNYTLKHIMCMYWYCSIIIVSWTDFDHHLGSCLVTPRALQWPLKDHFIREQKSPLPHPVVKMARVSLFIDNCPVFQERAGWTVDTRCRNLSEEEQSKPKIGYS